MRPRSFGDSLCCTYCCVGAPRVNEGSRQRVDTAGWPACEICGRRLSKVKHHRTHGAGRACKKHDTAARRAAAPASTLIPRSKRPYDSLQPTQQWKRRKQAREAVTQVLDDIGVPLEVIAPPSIPSPADVLHLSTAERDRFRTVRGVHLPCEQSIIQCKKLLATSHATEIGTFADGAYITDPLRYVSVLCAQSTFIAVGGDAGGGYTKLGVTYLHQGKQTLSISWCTKARIHMKHYPTASGNI